MRRRTKQREAIVEAFRSAGRPLSPSEALARARRRVGTVGQATVYRAIRALVEDGTLAAVSLPGSPPRYELARRARRHHHHFHCERCDRVYDIEGCSGEVDGLAPGGFVVRWHEIVLYGTCARCVGAGTAEEG